MIDNNFLNEYESLIKLTERPSRYIGEEFGSYDKNFDKVKGKFLFAFPDKYEIGISNFGHKIIYDLINKKDEFLCDRMYAPDKDYLNLLEKNHKSLYALETKRKPIEFDVVGFGLQYEMSYTTVLKMLEMSDIPIFSKERENFHPIIVAGGPSVSNPAPMEPFIDAFIIGDGEDVNIELLDMVVKLKGLARKDILKEISNIEGIYVPLFAKKTNKRIAKLEFNNHPTLSPIPHFASVHDRAVIELRRGCARLCRFCQASHINLPVRERKKEDIVELTKQYVKNTGYDEYSLLSLSSNDHCQIEDILKELNCHFKGSGINVSLPSQRADKFSLELAALMNQEKRATVTIAPEAGSERMRNIINKNLSEEQIINATISCIENGWNKIKYYFVIGLPFETYDDLEQIPGLIEKVNLKCREKGLKYPQITCSISVFVPKPHTPFQWARQNSISEIEEKINFLRKLKDKIKNVRFNFHNPKMSQLEAFYSRGDINVSKFIYEMYKKGGYLESWDENLNIDLYYEVEKILNFDIEALATKEYDNDFKLPWDNINYGVDKSWLWSEYEKARNAVSTVPCEVRCNDCGVCRNLKTSKVLSK